MPAPVKGLKTSKKLTDKAAADMSLDEYRLEYLVATLDGQAIGRVKPRRNAAGEQEHTMSPTSRHIAEALGLSFSSVRGWLSGRNTIRLPIQDLVTLAKGLGITVEQMAMLSANSCQGFSERHEEMELITNPDDELE